MSEDITSTLLPASRVDFFALDDGTAAHAQNLTQDWRFARVEVRSERMNIEGAISRYGESASPELIIVETDDIGDGFIAQLGNLAGVCAATTDAVVIGPKNDVHLYRSLVEMGIRDYLVRPVSQEDLVKIIARTLVEKRGLSGSRLVTVVGSKGGVGTSAVSQTLAWNMSETLKQKTMLLDVAGSAGSIGISHGLEPSASLAEAVRLGGSGSDDDLKRICQTVTEHLTLLVCGGEMMLADPADPDAVETLVNRLMQKFPVVVLDLSHAAQPVQKRMLARASEIVIVTTPMLSALRNARTLLSEIRNLRVHVEDVSLVVNMQGLAPSEEVPLKDLKDAMGMEPAAVVAWQPKIFAASETAGKPVGQNKAAADIMNALMPLAARGAAVENKAVAAE
ncbi:MAG: type II secretion protein ATPase, partial [Alphaproteobacteria bacterium]|nr:type II secretion protein ATPase [Alphaproteobacteria bacterium]